MRISDWSSDVCSSDLAICGSDLHLYDGVIPGVLSGAILGHEFMGEVVETGSGSTLKKGQRVVVPFVIACGKCFFCEKQQYSACDNSNPVDKQDIPQRSEERREGKECVITCRTRRTSDYEIKMKNNTKTQ